MTQPRTFSLLAVAIALCASGCGGSSATSSTAPAKNTAPQQALTITVTGKCSDPQGFRLKSTGLTPNGQYQTTASYPSGKPYNYLLDGGKGQADATGQPSQWTWDCKNGVGGQPDPNGTYYLRLVDLTTARSASTHFVVDESK